MSTLRISAITLIVAGILGLAYGGFTYTRETHEAQVGPIAMSISERDTFIVPIWAGVGAIVLGGVLLLVSSTKP
jgi:hypothetical protein